MNENDRQDALVNIIKGVLKDCVRVRRDACGFNVDITAQVILAAIFTDYTPKQFFYPENGEEKFLFRDYVHALYCLDFDVFDGNPPDRAKKKWMLQNDVLPYMGESPQQCVSILQSCSVMTQLDSVTADMPALIDYACNVTEKPFAMRDGVFKLWVNTCTNIYTDADGNDAPVVDVHYSTSHKKVSINDPILFRCANRQLVTFNFPAYTGLLVTANASFLALAALAAFDKYGFHGILYAVTPKDGILNPLDPPVDADKYIQFPVGLVPHTAWRFDMGYLRPCIYLSRLDKFDFQSPYVINNSISMSVGSINLLARENQQTFNMWNCI